jgi:thiosulfate sulfurtransferase
MQAIVSSRELMAELASVSPLLIIDVRRALARAADPVEIPGAVWRDPRRVAEWAAELPVGGVVAVYCVHGHEVSRGVAAQLRELGLHVRMIAGGLEGWKAAGGPVAACGAAAAGARR